MSNPWDEFSRQLEETASHTSEFIGLSRDEATALADHLGLTLRVTTPENRRVRTNLVARRITVYITDGAVAEARAG